MQKVDQAALSRRTEQARYAVAKDCQWFALDADSAPMLWHRSKCLHPDRPDPETTGRYEPCDLVWRGSCPYGFTGEAASRSP